MQALFVHSKKTDYSNLESKELTPYEIKKEKLKKFSGANLNQISLFEFQDDKIRKEIGDLEINQLTPIEALNKLSELKKKIKNLEQTVESFVSEKELINSLEQDLDRLNVEKNEIELENSELKKQIKANEDRISEIEARYRDLEAKILNIYDLDKYWSKISDDEKPKVNEIIKAIEILNFDRVVASEDFIVSPSEDYVHKVLRLIKMGRELNKD